MSNSQMLISLNFHDKEINAAHQDPLFKTPSLQTGPLTSTGLARHQALNFDHGLQSCSYFDKLAGFGNWK